MALRRMSLDQAQAWLWRLAEYSRDVHEEYAVQRWPETKRLLGLLVNSSGAAHGRNARRLVHASRKHDRRLAAARSSLARSAAAAAAGCAWSGASCRSPMTRSGAGAYSSASSGASRSSTYRPRSSTHGLPWPARA